MSKSTVELCQAEKAVMNHSVDYFLGEGSQLSNGR